MPLTNKLQVMPTKMRYKLGVAFCLMSLVPLLVGLYVASLFIQFPFEASAVNLGTISLIMGTSLLISFLGYQITRQMIIPIQSVAEAARRIAADGLADVHLDVKGADEIEELSASLRVISLNAKELLERVERLSQHDKLTGLFNGTYIRERLREEIERAAHFQRPCACALILITGTERFADEYGRSALEEFLRAAAAAITADLAPFDRAAVFRRGEFFVIFPDKNKKKAIESVLRIKAALAEARAALGVRGSQGQGRLGIAIGVSENPLDGASAEEIFAAAQRRAQAAAAKGADDVEAF